MTSQTEPQSELDTSSLTGTRKGPYLSHNPVSRTQIWQWCCAMGDRNPLYLDAEYQRQQGIDKAIAPPAMMQMWTMRDVNMRYASGSTDAEPYEVMEVLSAHGFDSNVAVSYDMHFHRLLAEGDRVHLYNTIASISELKTTALGRGYFFVEHAQYFDQNDALFAEAYITYFQYRAANTGSKQQAPAQATDACAPAAGAATPAFANIRRQDITAGDELPALTIPITHKLIIAGALAGQDFVDVHHNAPAAVAAGMPDIFMNILTTCGLCARYLTDWAGPGSRLQRMQLKLLAPNTPGDTMVLQGKVASITDAGPAANIEFAGKNSLGVHVAGSASLILTE